MVRARRKSSIPLEGTSSADFSDLTTMDAADATDSFTMFVNSANNISEGLLLCLFLQEFVPRCELIKE